MQQEQYLAREAIRDTLDRYSVAGDECDLEGYVACFAPDAVLEFVDFPGLGDLRFEGIAAIREFAGGFFRSVQSGQSAVPGGQMRHHLTTCRIDLLDDGEAEVLTYCIAITGSDAPHSGTYRDRFRRSGERWLIAHRQWRVESRGPESDR